MPDPLKTTVHTTPLERHQGYGLPPPGNDVLDSVQPGHPYFIYLLDNGPELRFTIGDADEQVAVTQIGTDDRTSAIYLESYRSKPDFQTTARPLLRAERELLAQCLLRRGPLETIHRGDWTAVSKSEIVERLLSGK